MCHGTVMSLLVHQTLGETTWLLSIHGFSLEQVIQGSVHPNPSEHLFFVSVTQKVPHFL